MIRELVIGRVVTRAHPYIPAAQSTPPSSRLRRLKRTPAYVSVPKEVTETNHTTHL